MAVLPTFRSPNSPATRAILETWDLLYLSDDLEAFTRELSGHERWRVVLFAAFCCFREVQNGGFHQFFLNSTGALAPEAVIGLKELGLREFSRALEVGMGFFGSVYPRLAAARHEALSSDREEKAFELFERLERQAEIDTDFLGDDFDDRMDRYAAAHTLGHESSESE